MNKLTFASAAVVLSSVLPATASAGTNLFTNPGFEQGKEGWTRIDAPSWKICEGEGYEGSKALVWENEDPKRYVYPARKVVLRPGCSYHFTALVKVDRADYPNKKKNPVQVGIEWSDRNGKWMSGCYAQPVDDNGMLKDGWVRYEGTTVRMPPNVGGAGLLPVMLKGTVGRVRFDNFTFEEYPAQTLGAFVSSAFRNAAEKGKVRFLATLFLDTATRPLSSYGAELRYRAADKKTVVAQPASFSESLATFELDVAKLAIGSQVVTFAVTDRDGKKTIAEKTLRFTRLVHPSRRRVSYDGQRRMLLDGKLFFPLGMYTGNMAKEDFRVYGEGPFNFAIQYGTATVAHLDEYEKLGVLVAADVRSLVYGYNYSAKSTLKTFDQSKEVFRAKYAEVGDHPALLMWYLNDEAPLSMVENISNVNDFLHEIDPARATLTCICRPAEASHFVPSYDFVAIDTYPIGYKNISNTLYSVWARQTSTDDYQRHMRPTWYIPQAFQWKWYMSPEAVRAAGIVDQHFPTRAEMMNMNWQGIAGGANGIVMYSFASMRKSMDETYFRQHWPDVLSVAREIKSCESILLKDSLWTKPELTKDCVARAWGQDGRKWYLVVNRSRDPAKCTVDLLGRAASVETVVGSGVKLAADGRALDCAFKGLGYALVEVK